MRDYIVLVNQLREYLHKDKICLYYHGLFDDMFTDKLILLIDQDVEKKAKKRTALLISESFQNIVRHGDNELGGKNSSLFGIRGIAQFIHIFSFNLVDTDTRSLLETRLKEINSLNKEQIKAYYTETLQKGEMSEKGGAGLGLIEMARKSERPIQKEFKERDKNIHAFYMQVDLMTQEALENENTCDPLPIQQNEVLHQLITDYDIIFLFKGDFSSEIMNPMFHIMKENTTDGGKNTGYKIFHPAVELMQNVARHGCETEGRNEGIFSMNKTSKGYYLCTGNYTDGNVQQLREQVNRLNSLNKEELDNLYREVLKENAKNENNNAGVGLIDLKRKNNNPIQLSCLSDSSGNYVIIGVEIDI